MEEIRLVILLGGRKEINLALYSPLALGRRCVWLALCLSGLALGGEPLRRGSFLLQWRDPLLGWYVVSFAIWLYGFNYAS